MSRRSNRVAPLAPPHARSSPRRRCCSFSPFGRPAVRRDRTVDLAGSTGVRSFDAWYTANASCSALIAVAGAQLGLRTGEQRVDEVRGGPAERIVVGRVELRERRTPPVFLVEHDRREVDAGCRTAGSPRRSRAFPGSRRTRRRRTAWLRMYMSGAYDTSIMPSRSSTRVLPQRDGRRFEEQRALAHDGLHAADVLVDEPQRHRVLVHHVVEEVAARALVVEAPRRSPPGRARPGTSSRCGRRPS